MADIRRPLGLVVYRREQVPACYPLGQEYVLLHLALNMGSEKCEAGIIKLGIARFAAEGVRFTPGTLWSYLDVHSVVTRGQERRPLVG